MVLSFLVSSALLIAAIPSSVGMFEYRPTTSIDTGKEFGGNGVLLRISRCLRRSGVSCKYAGISGTRCFEWWSTNWLIFSVMELHPLTIGLPGGRFGGTCFLCTLNNW